MFEQRIGQGQCIILVISDKYLRSEHCMFELVEVDKNRDLRERIALQIARERAERARRAGIAADSHAGIDERGERQAVRRDPRAGPGRRGRHLRPGPRPGAAHERTLDRQGAPRRRGTLQLDRGILRVARKVPPGKEDDFEIFSNDSLIAQFNTFTMAVRVGVTAVSSIALLAAEALPARLTRSTLSETAAWAGTRTRNRSW